MPNLRNYHSELTQVVQKLLNGKWKAEEDYQQPIPLEHLGQGHDEWEAAFSFAHDFLKDESRVRELIPLFLSAGSERDEPIYTQRTGEMFDALARGEQPESEDELEEDRKENMLNTATFLWKTHCAMNTQDVEESRLGEARDAALRWMDSALNSNDKVVSSDIKDRITDAVSETAFHAIKRDVRYERPENFDRFVIHLQERSNPNFEWVDALHDVTANVLSSYALPLALSVGAGSQAGPIGVTGRSLFRAVQEHVSAKKMVTQLDLFYR